jgi:F-type H+-transporting ATPase subunit delta|tara:strand:+ start:739 stop:1053 length:315 start_codon:yes stop_codon:yes gene_type:complete
MAPRPDCYFHPTTTGDSPPYPVPPKLNQQYFVSSGFAFVHANSVTDVMAVEAIPLEQLDGEAVKKALADYQAKLVNAKDDYEKASAQIGIEVTQAMESAVSGKA